MLAACLSALPVCLPALAALLACSTPTFVVRARALQRWGRKVRLRRGLCNPSLSGASPSSFRRSFYFFLRFVVPFSFHLVSFSARPNFARVQYPHVLSRTHDRHTSIAQSHHGARRTSSLPRYGVIFEFLINFERERSVTGPRLSNREYFHNG